MATESTSSKSDLPVLQKLPARSYWAVVVSTLAFLAYYTSQFWPNVFGVQIMEDWGLTATELGMLSTVVFIGNILVPLFSSQLVAKFSEKFLVGFGFILTVIAAVPLPFIGGDYVALLITRIILGFAGGFLTCVLGVHLAHWFTKNSRGLATGIFMGGLGLGMTCASFLGSGLTSAGLSWVDAATIMSLATAVLVGILYMVTLPAFSKVYPGAESMDDLIQEKYVGQRSTRFDKYHTATNLKQVLKSGPCWMCALFSACTAITVYGLGYTLPIYLQVNMGTSLATAAALIGITFAFKIVAAPIAGWLSDRVFHGERFQVNMIDSIAAMIMILLILVTPIDLMALVLILAFMSASLYGGTFQTMGIDVAPKAAYEAHALVIFGGSIGGFFSTLICGALIDATGTAVSAVIAVAIITGIGAIFAYFSRI